MIVRSDVCLPADPKRVLARLFVPGHESLSQESRATGVLARILAMPEDVVRTSLADVLSRFGHRQRDLPAVLRANYKQIAHRVPDGEPLSAERRDLIGAWFTHEFSVEGAALCNPSAVAHPDQSELAPGQLRVLLSLRAIGEGHLSCIEFRTGVIGPGPVIVLDGVSGHLEQGSVEPTSYDRELFGAQLVEAGSDVESTRFLLSRLGERFSQEQLDAALSDLRGQHVTRLGGVRTEELARHLAASSYRTSFDPKTALSERVLWPQSPRESHGLEDARFVRFTDAGGKPRYLATYTAFDGSDISPQRIETTDFLTFTMSPLAGASAKNKGLALFPRMIGGRWFALSRWDRENCTITSSEDGLQWHDSHVVYRPDQPWSLIQTGNCGSPLETDCGWLVLTHGVGPLREYVIGALLLDLEDPTVVLGSLREPLLRPAENEREGYVPNVVYSCGGLLHDGFLLLPYGVSDAAVRFAFVELAPLLELLLTTGPPAVMLAKSSA